MFGEDKAQRRRNARDLERRMRELDELDRRFGLGALPATTGPREVRRTRHGVRNFWVVVLTMALLGVVIAIHPSSTAAQIRGVVATGLSRLGVIAPSAGDGTYAFIATQRGGREPVGYDPCSEIRVEVNAVGAPANWKSLVARAIDHVGSASGLKLVYAGETDNRDVEQVGEPGNATVLVMWATEEDFPVLEGQVAGVGGSSAVERRSGHREFVSGRIVLDRDAFEAYDGGDLQIAVDQAIVDHEFGHVVGLDHVDDPGELMAPETDGRQLSWGPGDREGLELLGAIDCH
ncbi:matrixin family metalloprotease [Nocardioides sp. InS609-2]|uniref:matrixin family metalloprotease n=1 Tax=Nocardioides sp. InS609-2 TaxID=2760705 RepID=UPI00209769C0|nr:matrixin family metalloprotease [Nocardioides sp. InS609-2]